MSQLSITTTTTQQMPCHSPRSGLVKEEEALPNRLMCIAHLFARPLFFLLNTSAGRFTVSSRVQQPPQHFPFNRFPSDFTRRASPGCCVYSRRTVTETIISTTFVRGETYTAKLLAMNCYIGNGFFFVGVVLSRTCVNSNSLIKHGEDATRRIFSYEKGVENCSRV